MGGWAPKIFLDPKILLNTQDSFLTQKFFRLKLLFQSLSHDRKTLSFSFNIEYNLILYILGNFPDFFPPNLPELFNGSQRVFSHKPGNKGLLHDRKEGGDKMSKCLISEMRMRNLLLKQAIIPISLSLARPGRWCTSLLLRGDISLH